jgi:hypothetical protein
MLKLKKEVKIPLALGVEAQDKITGFVGIVVCQVKYLYGCNQWGLAPRVLSDGKRVESDWFDEGRLQVVGKGIKPASVQVKGDPGPGRMPAAARKL